MILGAGEGIGAACFLECCAHCEIRRVTPSQFIRVEANTTADASGMPSAITERQAERIIGKSGLYPDRAADAAVAELDFDHFRILDPKLLGGLSADQDSIVPDHL